jgi:hypothetical protein
MDVVSSEARFCPEPIEDAAALVAVKTKPAAAQVGRS